MGLVTEERLCVEVAETVEVVEAGEAGGATKGPREK
jgi:hypothetical protein